MADPRLNARLTEMAMNDPVNYAAQMKAAGRGDELSVSDKLRSGIMGMFKAPAAPEADLSQTAPMTQDPDSNQPPMNDEMAAKRAALMRYRNQGQS